MICARAGIDRDAFDEMYADKDDCVLQAYGNMAGRFIDTVFAAYGEHSEWRDGLRAAGYAAARWIRDHPDEARFGMKPHFQAGKPAAQQHARTVATFIKMVDKGRDGPDALKDIPEGTAERVLGSIVQTIGLNLGEAGAGGAEKMVPHFMFIAVSAYRGREAAEDELTIAAPPYSA
jgi:hypothetical protein